MCHDGQANENSLSNDAAFNNSYYPRRTKTIALCLKKKLKYSGETSTILPQGSLSKFYLSHCIILSINFGPHQDSSCLAYSLYKVVLNQLCMYVCRYYFADTDLGFR